jgi:DnaK suppressor protein
MTGRTLCRRSATDKELGARLHIAQKGHEQMITEHLKLIRQQLDSQLKKAGSSRAAGDSIRIQQVADPVDMTQEALARDLAVQILDRESTLVRRLRSAIDRIDEGSYGVCLECEERIASKRLKAIPWAELCISCQERADASSRRQSRAVFEDLTEAA